MIISLPRRLIDPSIWHKSARIRAPQVRRPVNCPRCDRHAGPSWHSNAAQRGRANCVAECHWHSWVEAENLVADGVEEGKGFEGCGEVRGRGCG